MPCLEQEILDAHQRHPEFIDILNRLREAFSPSGQLENLLVAQMASLQWSIHRLAACESSFLSAQLKLKPGPESDPLSRPLGELAVDDHYRHILGGLTAREATLDRLYRGALQRLRLAQSLRTPENP